MVGRRFSQIMKNVRVTNIAVIIEAMMPMIKRDREPLHRSGAELEEEQRRQHGADVGVDDGVHRVLETLIHREPDRLAVQQLLAHSLEDQHVGVHRDADREHDAREPRAA